MSGSAVRGVDGVEGETLGSVPYDLTSSRLGVRTVVSLIFLVTGPPAAR